MQIVQGFIVLTAAVGLSACSGGGSDSSGSGASSDSSSTTPDAELYPTAQDAFAGWHYRANCSALQLVALEVLDRKLRETDDEAERDQLAIDMRTYRERGATMSERAMRPARIANATTTEVQEEAESRRVPSLEQYTRTPIDRAVSQSRSAADSCWDEFSE